MVWCLARYCHFEAWQERATNVSPRDTHIISIKSLCCPSASVARGSMAAGSTTESAVVCEQEAEQGHGAGVGGTLQCRGMTTAYVDYVNRLRNSNCGALCGISQDMGRSMGGADQLVSKGVE